MLTLGSKVIIVSDLLEQSLPVGDYGYIIAYDRNQDNIFDYVLRVPKLNRNFLVPEEDIALEQEIIRHEAMRVEREALIDFALATHNEELFKRIMQGDEEEETQEEETKESVGPEDFIRQINLKAWI